MDVQERFARGDISAFEALFRAHQADVYRWCLRIVRDHATAEDVAMDAFHRAWRSHATFDPSKHFVAWIRRIATNLALDHLRAEKRNVPLMIDRGNALTGGNRDAQRDTSRMAPEHEAAALAAAQVGTGVMRRASSAATADPAVSAEQRENIAGAFAELSPKLRVVATLALIEDRPYAEIADALGISEAAARVRAHRAMEFLRGKLQHLRNE
jgi:RNA polymerase sigma factor (sigma-70 family)